MDHAINHVDHYHHQHCDAEQAEVSQMIPLQVGSLLKKDCVMEKRTRKLTMRKAGGNASENAFRYSLELPKPWIDRMGATPENNVVELIFDGEQIIIKHQK